MERNDIIGKLRQREAELKRAGVLHLHLYLFGSAARNEAQPDSDVDLFFDYEREKFGLFELMNVKELAADILKHETDIMTRDSIHPLLREQIEISAVNVF